jgi:hypothetical protein
MKKIVKKADILLFILLIVIAAAGIVLMSGAGTGGATATVRVDGEVVKRVDLGVDQKFWVGDVELQVKDGAIAFIESDCPGKECIHAGWLKNPGSSAACLPNHVSVTIEGQSGEQQEVDTIAE